MPSSCAGWPIQPSHPDHLTCRYTFVDTLPRAMSPAALGSSGSKGGEQIPRILDVSDSRVERLSD